MSSEKRAESCLKIPQNSQKRFVQIRVIRGTSFAFFATFARENFVGLRKFYIFVPTNWNQIKKGENDKQKRL